jgi:hypothetical protein
VAAGPEHVIEPVEHATALIDSLGAPPFPRADAAPHYFAAVYARATGMALVLAQAYGIVADEADEEAEGDDDTAALDAGGSVTSDT